ncbi:MAG: hypothetical protein ACP5VP_02260 [Candidatus Limnocylindrales bacterium]
MQHSLAPGHSARLMPRFVAPSAQGREERLGLHRMTPGMTLGMGNRTGDGRRMGLRDWRGMHVAPPRRQVSGLLRREPAMHWTESASGARVPAPVQAAPWHR